MTDTQDASGFARDELLPLLEGLCRLAREEGEVDQAFFGRVHEALTRAREPEDLAGPFMELSASAFLGFRYSPLAAVLLDRVLELAQHVSMTLSATTDEMH